MTERLDKAITSVQDFVLDRMGGVLTEQEAADLQGRITLLVNESRFPFEMEMVDMNHGIVITVPEQYSVQEAVEIRRSFVRLIKSDVPVFICHGDIKIQKLHADLVLAARRFVNRCYACRGVGVVGEENETPMNCGICADLRAALSFFDKHNIPQSREKDCTQTAALFRKGDRLLYAVGDTRPENGEIGGFISYVRTTKIKAEEGPHSDETDDWQPLSKIALDGYVEPQLVSTSCIYPDPIPTVKYSTPVMKFDKGDPVLWREIQAVFGWYLYVSDDPEWSGHPQPSTNPQPQCIVFTNAHPNHERNALTKDLKPWVHSSSSMPSESPASQD